MLPGAIVNLDDLTKIDHMKRAIGMPDITPVNSKSQMILCGNSTIPNSV